MKQFCHLIASITDKKYIITEPNRQKNKNIFKQNKEKVRIIRTSIFKPTRMRWASSWVRSRRIATMRRVSSRGISMTSRRVSLRWVPLGRIPLRWVPLGRIPLGRVTVWRGVCPGRRWVSTGVPIWVSLVIILVLSTSHLFRILLSNCCRGKN